MDYAAGSGSYLSERIREDLLRAERIAARLRRLDTRLVVGILFTTAFATLVAGFAAAAGPPLGEGAPAWRLTCGFIAVLTALSGLLTGAHQRFQVAERRARALACSARLRALELAVGLSRRDVAEVAREYEEVVGQYPELAA
jgi:hypothetical protein